MEVENSNLLANTNMTKKPFEKDLNDKNYNKFDRHNNNTKTSISTSKTTTTTSVPITAPTTTPTLTTTTIQQENQITQMKQKQLKATMSVDERNATKKSLLVLIAIFFASLAAMCYVCMIFPELNETEKQHIKIPRDIQDAKMLAKVLDRYKDMYYFEVMFGVVIAYVFLQTFAIPGSLFLSILLGFLYKFPIALFLICFCSSLGATLCYCLSNLVGRRLIRHFWPKKTSEWSQHVEQHRNSLFNYILFLRMTPLLPNWFINLASPVIGVPLLTFACGTFFGVAPPSVLAIQAGKTLQKMSSSSEAFSWTSMGILTVCACLSLLPGILKNKQKNKLE